MPFGGIRIVEKSCEAYGRKVDDEVENIFHHYRKHIMMVFLMFILLILELLVLVI